MINATETTPRHITRFSDDVEQIRDYNIILQERMSYRKDQQACGHPRTSVLDDP